MKNLLSMLAVFTLVGTSASNLKPVLINDVVSRGFKSIQKNNKDISIKNQNDKKPFDKLIIKENFPTSSIFSLLNGAIYVGTKNQGLWKSNDGINFNQVKGIPNDLYINDIAIAPNETVYVATNGQGLWKSNDGINFNQVKGIPNDYFVSSIVCSKDGKIFLGNNSSGSEKGVYKSTDGIKFTKMIGTTQQIQSLAIDKDDNVYAGTTNSMGDQGIIYKSNGTKEFTEIFQTDGSVEKLIIDSSNNLYVGTEVYNTKQGNVYKSTDEIKFTKMIGINISILSLAIDSSNNVYVGTVKGLYKSNGTNEFIKVHDKVSDDDIVNSVIIDKNDAIYVGTQNKGFYITNPINLLIKMNKPDTFDKSWPLYNGIVYNSAQKIDIKDNLVASAILDGKSITIPTTDLDIPSGEHNLILTLKDKTLASVFGGDPNTGQVTYKLWVKTSIDKKEIQYSTNIDDTDLTDLSLGFIADVKEGKTTYHNSPIIETKSKDGTGTHNASLNIDFKDILIDYPNSFYVQGNVDSSNNFTVTGTHKTFSKNLSIQTDGIYHLHLVDMVGNNYDSYLELGESNWKLKGTFNDDTLNRLKNKLNVSVNLTDPKQLAQATGWLTNYDKFASNLFVKSLQENGKGFDQDIKKDLENDFKWFLKHLTYEPNNEPNFNDGIDKVKLISEIAKIAEQKLQNGLTKLKLFTEHLNVDTKNVVNKSTLDSYSIWIKGYDAFINNNKDQWINDVVKVSSRGFATKDQENTISNHIHSLDFKNYLQHVEWTPTTALTISSDYKQFIELNRLQNDTINWVNQNLPDINKAYQQAIKNAESGLNLHRYSIDEILNGKSKPQTKNEINNFADGQSYHDWLQSESNIKFHGWQLKIGLPIGLISLVVAVVAGVFIYRRTNPKYHGYWRGKKEAKLRKSNFKKNDIDKDNKSD